MAKKEDFRKAFSESINKKVKARVKGSGRLIGYVFAIIFNVAFIYVVNSLPNWPVNFLTDSYSTILVLLNIMFVANIIINILFLFYDEAWFKHLLQFFVNIWAFFVFYSIYFIFPFDLTAVTERSMRMVLIIIMVGIAIAIIVEFIQFTFGNIRKQHV
ncbi:MAG: hypothetical protein HW405_204 [Candidatus Berkelbacteria bacterium]|nr:hypothetical protein [Candidatus Berkelbacteria bacterium]